MAITPERLQGISYFQQRPWALLNAMGELVAHGFLDVKAQERLKKVRHLGEVSALESGLYTEGWAVYSVQKVHGPLASRYAWLCIFDAKEVADAVVSVLFEGLLAPDLKEEKPGRLFERLLAGNLVYEPRYDGIFSDALKVPKRLREEGTLGVAMMVFHAPDLEGPVLVQLLKNLEKRALFAIFQGHGVVVTKAEEHLEVAGALSQWLQEELMVKAHLAHSAPVMDFEAVPEMAAELVGALQVATRVKPQQDAFDFQTLAFAIAIYHQRMANQKVSLMNTAMASLGPVLQDPELIHTALVFFKHSLNVTDAANALFVHRNTLLYRLQKIAQLTHLDLRRFEDAVNFYVLLGTSVPES